MDVFKISKLKSAILFDANSLINGKNDSLIFLEYLSALGNFIANNKVSKSIICVPPTYTHHDPVGFDNSKFFFSEDTIENHMITIAKDRSIKLIVCFGQLAKFIHLCTNLKFSQAIIITEDAVGSLLGTKIAKQYHILPARILTYLGSAFWWRVTPIELIPHNLIQYTQVPDKSLNEIELLAQVAISKSKNPVQFEPRNRILKLMNDLCKEQITNQLTQISCYMNDLRDQNISQVQQDELFNIIACLFGDLDAQFLRYSVKEMNSKRILELLMKFQTVLGMARITYFNENQMKLIDQYCDENRKVKGQLPRRFDYTQFDYTLAIISRKRENSPPCPKCQKVNKIGDNFCNSCGQKLQ